jgi:ubiquinone/menaquinone biosynthesis C-methylase UbiE
MVTGPPLGEHDWHSYDYVDRWISSDVTRDEERRPLLRKLVSFIPFEATAAIRVLDIGAGYGLLTQQVLEMFPRATVVCHDYSEPMFAHARQRLAWAADRVSFVKADLLDPSWSKAVGGPFEAVVSAIAIHNVRHPERIKAVYHEIFPLVKPGGCFLNYDHIFPRDPALGSVYRRARLVAYQQAMKEQTGQEKGVKEMERELRQRSPMERRGRREGSRTSSGEPTTLENQLRWLREAGFDASDCLWKDMQTTILGGFKTG